MGITENIDGKKVSVSGKVFTVSNLISFSRVFIAFPIMYIHYRNNLMYNTEIIVLLVYGVISDYLDGLVARKTNTISEVGKMIDPISDKLCAGALFIYTVWLGWVPTWFLIFFVVRDVLIILGSSFIKVKYGKVAMSTMSGKISVNIISAYWLSVFFLRNMESVHQFLLVLSVLIMTISFLDYFNRYRRIMKGAQFN
ncbi:MAG: CDP-alcohol phosphatidyltransferase family protein [Balneolaceae bacterium]|nr:CDP-alcohol phosphatidyltransferase family protein [Balneolaceae bacterium]